MSSYRTVKRPSIGEAWLESVSLIMLEGKLRETGESTLKEILNLQVVITDPSPEDIIIRKYGDRETIDFMMDNFFKKAPVEDWGYSYGTRIFGENGLDLLKKHLTERKDSTRAVFTLLSPVLDTAHTPCLTQVQAIIRERKLVLTCIFRSQDFGKKHYADALALTKLGRELMVEFGIDKLELVMYIANAHILEDDFDACEKIIKYETA